MANDGTALGALKEIIGNAGGTSDAQTLVPAIEDLGEIIGSGGGGGGGGIAVLFVATDEATAAAMSNVGLIASFQTPKDLANSKGWQASNLRLCWSSDSGLESGVLTFYGVQNGGRIVPYIEARGHFTTASGILGVDESWTIE